MASATCSTLALDARSSAGTGMVVAPVHSLCDSWTCIYSSQRTDRSSLGLPAQPPHRDPLPRMRVHFRATPHVGGTLEMSESRPRHVDYTPREDGFGARFPIVDARDRVVAAGPPGGGGRKRAPCAGRRFRPVAGLQEHVLGSSWPHASIGPLIAPDAVRPGCRPTPGPVCRSSLVALHSSEGSATL
ncbi:hypothetical protein MRX96_034312 [Rhipicephalus microplus]